MLPLPKLSPYGQTVPAVMNYLLSHTYPRYAISSRLMQFVDSVVEDPAKPELATARFTTFAAPEDEPVRLPYQRMELARYCELFTPNLRYLPLGDTVPSNDQLLEYVLNAYQILLIEQDVAIDVSDELDSTTARRITVTPVTDHPIWYGAMELHITTVDDIRPNILRLVYPGLNPTDISA